MQKRNRMERETIIQLLRIYTTLPESTREKLADAILNHQKINMPTDEEIEKKFDINESRGLFKSAPNYKELCISLNSYRRFGAKWMRDEILKRNK